MKVRVAAYPAQVFDAEIVAINPKVDNETRNLQVRAALENPDGKLLPGMFANLEVMLPGEEQRVVVPETAITFTLYGDSIYVVGQKKDEQGQVSKDDRASRNGSSSAASSGSANAAKAWRWCSKAWRAASR